VWTSLGLQRAKRRFCRKKRGKVAERLNAAVCHFPLTCSHRPIFICFVSLTTFSLRKKRSFAGYCSTSVQEKLRFNLRRYNFFQVISKLQSIDSRRLPHPAPRPPIGCWIPGYDSPESLIAACRMGFAQGGTSERSDELAILPHFMCSRSFGDGARPFCGSPSSVLSKTLARRNTASKIFSPWRGPKACDWLKFSTTWEHLQAATPASAHTHI
jgi:hypothetical protein